MSITNNYNTYQMKNCSIKTMFGGIELSNPIIASSCGLTGSATNNESLSKAGVGAIVLKSLFEEDIIRESAALSASAEHSEAADYMQAYVGANALNDYIRLIEQSKALCGDTPIIASINCANSGEWIAYARAIEAAGADGLELNIMTQQSDPMSVDGELESRHIAIAKSIREVVKLPIIMKLGAQISNHASLISRLQGCGVNGFVLLNRAYPLDIDIDKVCYTHGAILSEESSLSTPLRLAAITSAAVPNSSLAVSGGIRKGECIVKAILAGASVVEVCSTLYRKGNDVGEWVSEALYTIQNWMDNHGYQNIEEFRGVMNNRSEEHSDAVMRTQFLKHFGSYHL